MIARWKRSGLLLTLSMVLLVGCSPQGNGQRIQSAHSDYAKVRDQFLTQEGYSFHGRTKLLTGTTANGNLVNFSGRVNKKDTLLNVELSMPEEKRAKSMSLLSKDQKLYAKLDENNGWQPVDRNNFSLKQEFDNWDPKFSFQQMEDMGTRFVPFSETMANENMDNDNVKAIRVILDSTKLKKWLSDQLKRQHTSAQIQSTDIHSTHTVRQPLAVTLTDGDQLNRRSGASIQQADANITDVIDGMDLEADYKVYYNQSTMLPTQMIMNIRSEYTLNNQRIKEHSEIKTYLMHYGQSFNLPSPKK